MFSGGGICAGSSTMHAELLRLIAAAKADAKAADGIAGPPQRMPAHRRLSVFFTGRAA